MTDAEFIFRSDSREKKNISHSAYKRVGNRKGCRLPSDNLTKKELAKLNGETVSVSLNKPMSLTQFKSLPNSLREEYLTHLISTYEARGVDIARMFGIEWNNLTNYTRVLNISFPRRRKSPSPKWLAFIESQATEEQPKEQPSIEPVKAVDEQHTTEKAEIKLSIEKGVLLFKGNPAAIFTKALLMFDDTKNYEVRLEFKEECIDDKT